MVSPMAPPLQSSADVTLRLSGFALWGSLLSLGSVAVCLVAAAAAMLATPNAAVVVLVLPLVSAAGAALSALGLREIGRGGGTIAGKPIALVGLFVGLGAATLQGAAALSAFGSAWAVKTELVPLVEEFMLAHARDDRAAMRAALGETVSRHLDDQRIDWVFAQLDASLGPTKHARFNLAVMLHAAAKLQNAAANAATRTTVIENPKPIELVFERGVALAFVIPDDEEIRTRKRVAISDMLIMLPDSSVLTLRLNGPATALANRLGWRVRQREIEPASIPATGAGCHRRRRPPHASITASRTIEMESV